MKIYYNGVIRDMTPQEEKEYSFETETLLNPVAEEYDASVTYYIGKCVQFKGGIYRLKTERARNIEPTNKTYWENVSLSDLIKDISKENEQ